MLRTSEAPAGRVVNDAVGTIAHIKTGNSRSTTEGGLAGWLVPFYRGIIVRARRDFHRDDAPQIPTKSQSVVLRLYSCCKDRPLSKATTS